MGGGMGGGGMGGGGMGGGGMGGGGMGGGGMGGGGMGGRVPAGMVNGQEVFRHGGRERTDRRGMPVEGTIDLSISLMIRLHRTSYLTPLAIL